MDLNMPNRYECLVCKRGFSIIGDGPYNKCVKVIMPAVWLQVFGQLPCYWVHAKCQHECEDAQLRNKLPVFVR